MLNVLHNICESNDLNVYNFEINIEGVDAKIAVPNEKNTNQEFYLLLECNVLSDDFIGILLNEYIEVLMDKMETLEYTDESTRKNSTLILCCTANSISDKSLIKLEENPYFFKKNIITYCPNELEQLKLKLNKQFSNEMLNNLLMSDGGDKFEEFKTLSLESNSYYPLLIRIMTKLPFVHYIPQDNQLDNLESFIKNSLNSFDNKLLDYICDKDGPLTDNTIKEKILSNWDEL